MDRDSTELALDGPEASDRRGLQELIANLGLGCGWRPPVEPLVEVEREWLLDQADLDQARRSQEVDDRAQGEILGVGPVPLAFDGVLAVGEGRVGVGRVVAQDDEASGSDQLGLTSDERRGSAT